MTDIQLALAHLGYRPDSPKVLTLLPGGARGLPERIPFYIRLNCFPLRRDAPPAAGFSDRFPSPFGLIRGKIVADSNRVLHRGELVRRQTRWGRFWQGDFTDFRMPGSYQIETDCQISVPFWIHKQAYDRIILGYLRFLQAQRCGAAVFGVHPACHLDDGILDDGKTLMDATGGWHDAGDFRKWLFFTLYHPDALATIHERVFANRPPEAGITAADILDEMRWGNRFFHKMITDEGRVYEDVGGGAAPSLEYQYDRDWWFENHPGGYGDATDNRWTDNVRGSGDERTVRTTYNPLVQFAFVHAQARCAQVFEGSEKAHCLDLAERAWSYGRAHGDDDRTVFQAGRCHAAAELLAAGSKATSPDELISLARNVMDLQENRCGNPITGYFYEKDRLDAYRSVAFSASPALALLHCWELREVLHLPSTFAKRLEDSINLYIEGYLLADAAGNPFGLTPYGIFLHPERLDKQLFRAAGDGRWIRTFMPPFNRYGLVLGLGGVLMSHAHALAKAGSLMDRDAWKRHAERLLQWTAGHNTRNRSLFTGIGYRQPVGYSFRIPQIPEALLAGFIGREDDSPYVEEGTATAWNTQEYWGVAYLHAASAVAWL